MIKRDIGIKKKVSTMVSGIDYCKLGNIRLVVEDVDDDIASGVVEVLKEATAKIEKILRSKYP